MGSETCNASLMASVVQCLHAAVRVEAHDRKRLEQLCRYITRPALSDERVQVNAAGQVELKLKTPWRDGTTHLVLSPLEFMQRLAALVPRPRLHLIRFHGVLAPNAKLRSLVVPQGPRWRNGPPQPLPPANAWSRPRLTRTGRTDRTELLGRGYSSACSTSTCSTAPTAAPGSSRSSRPSWSDR
ncbi:MAG: transposase [Betaproteobacteria bacterium]|nr:transposase [Betaproteobacteria bacterium]